MEKPAGSGGEEGDPPPLPVKSEKCPTKTAETKEPEKPVKPAAEAGIVKKKETSPVKSESDSGAAPSTSTPTKIKREDSADVEDGATASGGSRIKSDSSSTTSSHAGSVEDVQRALTEYMTMAQVNSFSYCQPSINFTNIAFRTQMFLQLFYDFLYF